jgi:maltooligosyltrehalose trehalohydrolase
VNQSSPLPRLGATVLTGGGVEFRVWSPDARLIELELIAAGGTRDIPLQAEADGYHVTVVADARAGERYRYHVDGEGPFPDPCSRSQPEGPHGPSEVVDPGAFHWTDGSWAGLEREGLVIYELHTGTFTRAGTFEAIIPELGRLADLGVTALELMPVAQFPGTRNWGYDGVDLFAPAHVYGGPEALRRLVDAAHRHGLGVILDVVYNHLGPDGNYLRAFSQYYFTDRHHTPWGDAVNVDGPHSRPVRDFIIANACRWLTEYHLDGLRLDAVHAIIDDSPVHILQELTERARAAAAPRSVVIIAESEANDVRLIRPDGYGLDGVWADDFHHTAHVCLTGERDGYYVSYQGAAAELAKGVNEGFIYQGQPSPRTGRPRGTRVTDEPGAAFVLCLQNHDQVGNRAEGERLITLTDRERYLALTALLLLAPETPLLFMGQEYGATTPFLYFTDHEPELGKLVTEGRRKEFAAFPAFQDPAQRERIPDPQAPETFTRSRLDPAERARNAAIERLHRDLLSLRRNDPVLQGQDRLRTSASAPALDVVAMARWNDEGTRLLLVNLGGETRTAWGALGLDLPSGPWHTLWHSRDLAYGGDGAAAIINTDDITVPAGCAVLLAADATPPHR